MAEGIFVCPYHTLVPQQILMELLSHYPLHAQEFKFNGAVFLPSWVKTPAGVCNGLDLCHTVLEKRPSPDHHGWDPPLK